MPQGLKEIRNVFKTQNSSVYLKYSWVADALWAVMILTAGYNSFLQNRGFFFFSQMTFFSLSAEDKVLPDCCLNFRYVEYMQWNLKTNKERYIFYSCLLLLYQ